MWRNFVNGTPMARQGLLDWFFLQKLFSLCMRRTKINWTEKKALNNPKKNSFFSGLSAIFSIWLEMVQPILGKTEFGLEWCSPFWDKLSLAWNGVAHFGTEWFCPRMGYPIPGQNQFVPEWAAPFQAKINLFQNGLHHIRKRLKTSRFFGGFNKFLVSIFCF